MAEMSDVIVCRRCGMGFTATAAYRMLLERRQAKVVVPVLCTTCFMRTGSMPKQRGQVKWFNPQKHYGFITTEESGEVFFHQRQIVEGCEKEALEGQIARFHLCSTGKGLEALNVELDGAEYAWARG